jgi:hypothetical protein
MHPPLKLLAMARSGGTLIIRHRDGRLWLYPPEAAGEPQVIGDARANELIARAELEPVDREFATWEELDEFRQRRAAESIPQRAVDIARFDLHDVERLVGVAERWRADRASDRARRLLLKLLHVPAVRADASMHEQIVGLLEELEEPRLQLHLEPATELQIAARERLQLPRAA